MATRERAGRALVVTPEQLGRARFEREQTARDVEVLAWVGRFRFVTAEALAAWSGVSVQKARRRCARLARAGLIAYGPVRPRDPWSVHLTSRGSDLLGLPRRAAPRLDVQREHELAIVSLCTELEQAGERLLTERECRRAERAGDGAFSVQVPRSQRNEARRWPDLVIDRAQGLVAVEIELSPKTTDRLGRIIRGYGASHYTEVVFHVHGRALQRRIEAIVARERETITWRAVVPMRVQGWPGAGDPGGAIGGVGGVTP